MIENELFDLDEIVSIEYVGEEETIDITVEGTHMFYANGIYTHNSTDNTEVVMTAQMGGSIKKAQIAHVIISIGKTLEQKENNLATITILKSRVGGDGIVFSNCRFNNALLIIDTETQNTLLGHEQNDNINQQVQRQEDEETLRARAAQAYLNRN